MTHPRIVALHEAAHIVVGARLRFRCLHASVRHTGESEGRSAFDRAPDARTPGGLRVLLAGDVAVWLARRGSKLPEGDIGPWFGARELLRPPRREQWVSSGTDREAIDAAGLSGETVRATRRDVALMLIQDWAAVRLIAGRLLEHGTLERPQIARALIDTGVYRERRAELKPAATPELLRPTDARRELRKRLRSRYAAEQILRRLPRAGPYIPAIHVRMFG